VWELLCFSILRRGALWLGALRCYCCKDVFGVLLPRRPSAIASSVLVVCCECLCEGPRRRNQSKLASAARAPDDLSLQA